MKDIFLIGLIKGKKGSRSKFGTIRYGCSTPQNISKANTLAKYMKMSCVIMDSKYSTQQITEMERKKQ